MLNYLLEEVQMCVLMGILNELNWKRFVLVCAQTFKII